MGVGAGKEDVEGPGRHAVDPRHAHPASPRRRPHLRLRLVHAPRRVRDRIRVGTRVRVGIRARVGARARVRVGIRAGLRVRGPPHPLPPPPPPGADLAPGQPAPDFTTTDQDGKPVHLADLKSHYVVVYFYPKDETPGCTHEACSFRDAWNDLHKKGVIIIGVSTDTADSHKAFAKHHQLPFTLVSDPKGEIAAKYGVPVENEKGESYVHRQSFVVGPDGNLKKIYRKVDVKVHAQEIGQDTSS